MRRLLSMRRVSVHWANDYYEREVGVVIREMRWGIGPGFELDIHYWPDRVLAICFYPSQPKFCTWDGCRSRPLLGDTECSDHALPF